MGMVALNIRQAVNNKQERRDAYVALRGYTQWMRTFFNSACCDELGHLNNDKNRAELQRRCGDCPASQGVSKFQVIAGLDECWTDNEIDQKTDSQGNLETCLMPLMEEDKKSGSGMGMDKEKAAMWNLIRNGLITCKKAQERVVRDFEMSKRNQGSQNNL